MDPVSVAVSESMNRKTRLPVSDDEAQVRLNPDLVWINPNQVWINPD